MQLPERDHLSHSKQFLESRLAILFGGRTAEEIIFGPDNVTTGAANDIQVATQTARVMVTAFGMSEKLGRVRYQANEQEVFLGHCRDPDAERLGGTAQLIDQEVRRPDRGAECQGQTDPDRPSRGPATSSPRRCSSTRRSPTTRSARSCAARRSCATTPAAPARPTAAAEPRRRRLRAY
jgi:hypothetical protein